jgi:hypothetical protein
MTATTELTIIAIHISVPRLRANPMLLNAAALTRMIVVTANRISTRPDPS